MFLNTLKKCLVKVMLLGSKDNRTWPKLDLDQLEWLGFAVPKVI